MQGEQRPGDWRFKCAFSGFDGWASESVVDERTGLRVLRRFADERHPQDYATGVSDDPSVPWAQPEATDTFVVTPITPADL